MFGYKDVALGRLMHFARSYRYMLVPTGGEGDFLKNAVVRPEA